MTDDQDQKGQDGDKGDTENDPGAGDSSKSDQITFTPEQQAHIDKLIADRMARYDESRQKKANAANEEAERKKEEARLAEEKKYQELLDKKAQHETQLQAQLDEANETIRLQRLRDAFEVEAEKQELAFADKQALKDAFDLAELGKIEINDEGEVTGMKGVLEGLKTTRPYLFKQPGTAGDIDATKGRGGAAPPDSEAKRAERRQRFRY